MAGLISVGVSAANNAQVALLTTQHNIANANTAGFNRQETVQTTSFAQGTGVGFIGQGAQIETVRRVYSEYLGSQVLSASAQAQFSDAYLAQISQIDNLLADTNAGLSPALNTFFTGVNAVSADPTSAAARQSLLSGGETLAARFQSLFNRLDEIRNGVDTQLQAQITDVNSYSAQIAQLNQKINEAQNFNNQPPNDLLDQRDQAIAKLNEIVKVSVAKQTDGSYNVYIGTGQSLVTGTSAFTLALRDDPIDPGKKSVNYVFGNSFAPIPDQSLESGGALGGLLAFRRTSLETAQNSLGRLALGFAQSFNEQHQLGQDLNGALGGKFFNIAATSPQISASINNNVASTLAFTVTGIDAGKLTTSNYLVRFDGTNYSLTDSVTNTTTSGLDNAGLRTALSNVGITLTTSGTPASGDQFLILPTRNGARDISVALTDPSAIASAAPIRTAANNANTGTATVSRGTVDTTNQPPLNANLQAAVTITFTGANAFSVSGTGTGNPTGVAYSAGSNISYNGWTIQIDGTPAAGDVFTVSANTGGVGDNRNAVALGALQSSKTLANNAAGSPTASYQDAYAQLVSVVGNDTRRTSNNSAAQQALLSNNIQTQQSLSGVNLDEEAANLLRFQQAYQAAAKIIQTSSTLFDTILGIR